MKKWTIDNIESQAGKTVIVTGANAGIGFETARVLSLRGAHVVMACRNMEKGEMAVKRITGEKPSGSVELMPLDLSDFESIKQFAKAFRAKHKKIDILINNAGLMFPPFSKTKEGFEMQIGVNYIGHFLLTLLLIDMLTNIPGARIVTISSIAHRLGKIDFENFRGEKKYKSLREYNQSKLADLMFAVELNQRLQKTGSNAISLAAHPGVTKSDLQRYSGLSGIMTGIVGMKASQGALPTLRAATDPNVQGGEYYGPHALNEIRGYPTNKCKVNPVVQDEGLRQELWSFTENLTGVKYPS